MPRSPQSKNSEEGGAAGARESLEEDATGKFLVYYRIVTKHALLRPLIYAYEFSHKAEEEGIDKAIEKESILYRRVLVRVRKRQAVGFVEELCAEDDGELRTLLRQGVVIARIEKILDPMPLMRKEDLRFCGWLQRYYGALPSEAYGLFVSFSETLIKKKPPKAEAGAREQAVPGEGETGTPSSGGESPSLLTVPSIKSPSLSGEQASVYDSILKELDTFSLSCIQGVTGSGKSYVYMSLAAEVARRGQITLILVPEISLVFQMESLLREVFPRERILLFHSKLASKSREKTLSALRMERAGEVRSAVSVIIGTRSALFLPGLRRLGLVIIDEEHENAFKNSSSPRYHVRQAGQQFARLRGIPLVFGSATPSLELIYLMEQGLLRQYRLTERYAKIKLPRMVLHHQRLPMMKRAHGASMKGGHGASAMQNSPLTTPSSQAPFPLPMADNGQGQGGRPGSGQVETPQGEARQDVDRHAVGGEKEGGNSSRQREEVSRETIARIDNALSKGGQVLVYINKRGFSAVPLCQSCGFFSQCPNCTVSLTYHKRRGELCCHYCGHTKAFIPRCELCGKESFRYPRYGTEQIVEVLAEALPDAAIARFDSDALRTTRLLEECLKQFSKGELNVLVGTQMLAKGHHFPNVRLMVILYPERTLLLPDFRAYERVYRELVQASGRAGRTGEQGEVWVETALGTDPLFRLVQEERFDEFYQSELVKRERSFYPPYSKVLRLVLRGENHKEVRETSEKLKRLVLLYMKESLAARQSQLLGPGPCLIERIAKNYRYHLTIKTVAMKEALRLIAALRERPFSQRRVFLEIDMDPIDLF